VTRPSSITDERYGADIDPPYLYPGYVGTRLRAPKEPLVIVPHTLTELTAPVFGESVLLETDGDLTRQHDEEPIGERVIVSGRVLGDDGRPVAGHLVEIWQANAAGRYRHDTDTHDAPIDPNFSGAGRAITDADGRYRFVTIKPGAYPWPNHANAWRPNHIHFSVFGRAFTERLVTQMYFPGDPLLAIDPIFQSVPSHAAARLVSTLDATLTEGSWALGYRFDIVVGGRNPTPGDPDDG
jgi:protocatechuate 3,4-dioxygenase beta subunit